MSTESRAVASRDEHIVNGVTYILEPLGIRELTEVQRAAIRFYRREYIQTYRDGLMIAFQEDESRVEALVLLKIDEVARWDVDDLPKKTAYALGAVPVSKKLKDLILKIKPDFKEKDDASTRVLVTSLLDSGALEEEEFVAATGLRPEKGTIPYDAWWITGVYAGMVEFIVSSIRKSNPTIHRADIERIPYQDLAIMAHKLEHLTAPDIKNM